VDCNRKDTDLVDDNRKDSDTLLDESRQDTLANGMAIEMTN